MNLSMNFAKGIILLEKSNPLAPPDFIFDEANEGFVTLDKVKTLKMPPFILEKVLSELKELYRVQTNGLLLFNQNQ